MNATSNTNTSSPRDRYTWVPNSDDAETSLKTGNAFRVTKGAEYNYGYPPGAVILARFRKRKH